jgi:hypothetical protein
VAKLSQASFTCGEISPSLSERVDLARYATSLRTCYNFFVRATGGASNRAGLQFVYALDPTSLATLIPFIFSTDQSYMLVFQADEVRVFADGGFVYDSSANITNVTDGIVGFQPRRTITTATPHLLGIGQDAIIAGITGSGTFAPSGTFEVLSVVSPTVFRIIGSGDPSGAYVSGGTVSISTPIASPYQSAELADIRYTQSADVLTLTHQNWIPHEFVRLTASTFALTDIDDFEGGPFLDDNVTATTMTASAATGNGITLTASTSVFTADHIGSLIRLSMEDLSAIPPWEPNKHIAATGVDPDGLLRRSNGKVYIAAGNSAAPSAGTYTGTVAPTHDEGTESDGDGGLLNGTANTRAGVSWQYLHSLFGTARITAQAGTTATADVLDYIPVVAPATTTIWAFGAWSEDQGYPALCTYYQDRLVFANTPEAPQTEWASKTGDYHNFGVSSPLVSDDAIRQPLNARQINAIVELIPMDQLIALTSSSSWASPKRGEAWTPLTIGYDPQSFDGAAFLRAILTGENGIFVQNGATKVRDIAFKLGSDKFLGEELTVLARHLFETATIVDMDYAKEPHGILWIIRSDGVLIGLTYLKEQEVIGWHRHETQGFFERVCVIPEGGIDVPYFIVRRTVNGATVRYLERMAVRDRTDILDSFFVDSGLTYDGRNTTATTITISGASYDGGETVTLTASAAAFSGTSDIGDAVQFPHASGNVRATITAYTSTTVVTAILQSPVPAALQAMATTTWTFARDTFSGLEHLEGMEVAILADGSPEVPHTVTDGQIVLAYPAGVVHIGLAYVADIETLDVTIFGASESIRDRAKAIPKVSVIVEKTLGLQAGPDEDNLYDCGLQPSEFDYNAPWALQSEPQPAYLVTSWNKSGRVLLRQDKPLPATVLAILPTVEIGGDG